MLLFVKGYRLLGLKKTAVEEGFKNRLKYFVSCILLKKKS